MYYVAKRSISSESLKELEDVMKANEGLRKERRELQAELEQSKLHNSNQQSEIEELKKKLSESETEKDKLSNTVKKLEAEDRLARHGSVGLKAEIPVESTPPDPSDALMEDIEPVVPNVTVELQNTMKRSREEFEAANLKLKREYEIGMLKQLKQSFSNLQALTSVTNAALQDTMQQIDQIVSPNQ